MAVPAGKHIGRYEVRSLLGVGGMGEVYLAQDTQLRRLVALKLLPPEFTRDEERLRRFKQEAFAASGLNHPNIFTIFEVGHEGDIHFIVTEYIEGLSLRHRMDKEPLPIHEVLDLGAQIASALSAAHAAGIVHRDIKPDNIIIRDDGYVKVLDFGLAKLTEYKGLVSNPEAATVQVVKTDPGKVMGTVNYMSPEQARGLEVDQRTDIWSLGVILYEMVAGRVPFQGMTSSDVVAAILRTEPVALRRYCSDVPDELQRIVRKALRKDPDERYHLAKEMALDLKNLRRELELSAEIERSVQPIESVAQSASLRNSLTVTATRETANTQAIAVPKVTSSAEYVISELKAHPKLLMSGLAIIALIAVAVIVSTSYLRGGPPRPSDPAANMKIARLTTTGTADKAAISPDGKYIVHAASENGQQSLRIRQVNTNSDVQIVPPSDVQYLGLKFSADGDFVYYVASEKDSTSNLYIIPALGGNARMLISNVSSSVTLSPDGQRLAFIRNLAAAGEYSVIVADTNGTNEHALAIRKLPNFFRAASWSPDGKSIICIAGSFVPTYSFYLVEIPLNEKREQQFGTQSWRSMGDLAWVGDGSGLIFSASDQESTGDSQQLWHTSYPTGNTRRVTYDLNNYTGVSITSDSKRLVTVQSETAGNLWTINSDWNTASELTVGSGRIDGRDGVAYAPDGEVVYASRASGNLDLWTMKADATQQRQLTFNSHNNKQPTVSPDGRYIFFVSDRGGTVNIWRIDRDGNNPQQLTSGSGEENPQCTPDGKWVLYTLLGAGKPTIWRVSITGGAPQQMIHDYSASPTVSPDGKSFACFYRNAETNHQTKLALFPIDGGQPTRIFDAVMTAEITRRLPPLRWTVDAHGLTYIVTTGGSSNFWLQPVSGEPAKQLTSFKTDQIFAFDWSRNGKQVIFSRGAVISDVVLITTFR